MQEESEGCCLISYAPLWRTKVKNGTTTYTLQVKGQISSSTIRRLEVGASISTNTLDALCNNLQCGLLDTVEYLPDDST